MNRIALSNGVVIAYVSAGPDDGTPVILVHGASQHHGIWRNQVDVLAAAGYRVHALDLPGHGASEPARLQPGDRTPEYAISDYAALVLEFGSVVAGAPFLLVGHSMSGGVVLNAALDGQDHLIGVIVVDGTSFARTYSDDFLDTVKLNVPGWLEANYRSLCARAVGPDRIRDAVAPLLDTAESTMWNDLLAFSGLDLRPGLGALTLPVAFICGELDWSVTVEMAEQTRALCVAAPTALRVISGVGHFPQEEAPEVLGAQLRELLDWATAHSSTTAARSMGGSQA
jgi:pimeloyl-ACP methyl ester carboxylesterase